MPVPKLDPERCRERNLADAARGLNSAPLRLATRNAPPPPDGWRIVTSAGWWPSSKAEALTRINATRPPMDDEPDLTEADVLLVYPEAANENFVKKYYMHLGLSTLRNIRAAAEDGIAFMNSHRTGGFSEACELPYGRTFAAKLERLTDPAGNPRARVLMAGYMIRGLHPNGANGPSTDDLHRSIAGGTLSDVSLGFLDAGTAACDVCGQDMDQLDEDGYEYVCPHVPGTHRSMSAEQVAAQKARGVPDGCCTFTLHDGQANEVSAVYDGALPGAGFRKAMKLARRDQMDPTALAEATLAFAPLLSGRPLADPFPDRARKRPASLTLSEGPPAPPAPTPDPPPTPDDTRPDVDQDGNWPPLTGDDMKLAQALALLASATDENGNIDQARLTAAMSGQTPPAPPREPAPTPAPTPTPVGNSPQLTALELRNQDLERLLADEKARNARVEHQAQMESVALEAETYIDNQIRFGRATSAERGELVTLYRQAASDDLKNPVQVTFRDPKTNATQQGTRLAALKASVERRPATATGQQAVMTAPGERTNANGARTLPQSDDATDVKAYDAEVKRLVSGYSETRNRKTRV